MVFVSFVFKMKPGQHIPAGQKVGLAGVVVAVTTKEKDEERERERERESCL